MPSFLSPNSVRYRGRVGEVGLLVVAHVQLVLAQYALDVVAPLTDDQGIRVLATWMQIRRFRTAPPEAPIRSLASTSVR